MNINNSINNSLQGIQKAQNKVTEASKQIVNPELDKTKPLVDLVEAKHENAANTKALQTSNDMIGTIINIKA